MRPFIVACAISLASAQYKCPASWTARANSPKCNGPASTDCSDAACCSAPPTPLKCSDYSVAWILAQGLGGGCRKGNKKYFFDTKKMSSVVADNKDTTIFAACCTANTAAKCSDWAMACKAGQMKDAAKNGNDAGVDGNTISVNAYSDKCCKAAPADTCLNWEITWGPATALGAGCREGGAKKFWDLKKRAAIVAGAKGNTEIAAACCTATSAAVCSDWSVIKSCKTASGYRLDSAKSNAAAPANAGADLDITQDAFNTACCSIPPTTCSAKLLSFGNTGCQKDNTNWFFDNKKGAVVTGVSNSEVKKNCCTPVEKALCSDWSLSFTCNSGTSVISAKQVGGKAKLGKPDKLKEKCCGAPLLCSKWVPPPPQEVDSAHSSALSLLAVGALAMGLIRG